MGSIMYSPNAMTPTDCRKEKKSGEQQLKSDKSTSFYEVTNTEDIDTVIAGKAAKASVFMLLINISKLHENKCRCLTNYCATVTLQKKTTFGLKHILILLGFPTPFVQIRLIQTFEMLRDLTTHICQSGLLHTPV